MNVSGARKGFTLVELLIVVTIIGILIALLLPVFLKARERTHQAVCMSNLHQIALAIQMYQNDHNGGLPEDFGDVTSIPPDVRADMNAQGLGNQGGDDLLPYEHTPNIYHCADRRTPLPAPDTPYLRDDYRYRVPLLTRFQEKIGLPKAIIKPMPSSVLVYDDNHPPYRDGSSIVLRADGSVSRIPFSRIAFWYNLPNGTWTQTEGRIASQSLQVEVFPGEPWPPQFEK